MHLPSLRLNATPAGCRRTVIAAWVLIALKCVLVTWAIDRWQVPIHPAWVIAPTLVFAALATLLWLTHRPE